MTYSSDTPISNPVDLALITDVLMGGFAFNASEGIFIPVEPEDDTFTPPSYPNIDEVRL